MKTLARITFLIIFLCSSCDIIDLDILQPKTEVEVYETGVEEYPLIVVDEEGHIFSFSQDMQSIYVQFPNADEWMMQFDDEGYPTSTLIQDSQNSYLVQYSEFESETCSMSITDLNSNKTEYAFDIEFENLNRAVRNYSQLKSIEDPGLRRRGIQFEFPEWYENNKKAIHKWGGRAMTAVSGGLCLASIGTAVGTGGFATAIAIANCGSFAASVTSSNIENDGVAVVVKSGTLPGKFAEAALKCTIDKTQCIKGTIGAIVAVGTFLNTAKNRQESIVAAQQLTAFIATGGVSGTWAIEGSQNGIDFKQSYYFGINNGIMALDTYQSTTQADLNALLRIEFDYQLLSANSMKMELKEVYQKFTITDKVQNKTSTQEIGPMTWKQYFELYPAQAQDPSIQFVNGGEFNYELSDDKKTLILVSDSDRLEFQRESLSDLIIGKAATNDSYY